MFVTQRVQNGIELLNNYYVARKDERWYNHINIYRLNMASSINCVLGQLFGDFFVGVETLSIKTPNHFDSSYTHGFSINHDYAVSCASFDMCQECRQLQSEWVYQINILQNAYQEGLI